MLIHTTDIDADISQQTRSQIDRLIAQELSSDYQTSVHPSIPEIADGDFSDLMQKEIDRKAAGKPISGGIDLGRYEAPEPPETTSGARGEVLNQWKEALQQAYASSAHLSMRVDNLSLLEDHGRNAWLIGNAQLEGILRDLEKELADVKQATEQVNKTRKLAQEGSKGEMIGLEETWKQGIRRIIEVELAAENLRQQILETRRQNSS